MISQELELNIVLIGWVIPILLGLVLLVIKTPETQSHIYYQKGKLTCAIAFLLFGVEILSQWVMRVLEVGDPILSVSVYLLVFYLATLLPFCRYRSTCWFSISLHYCSQWVIAQ